MRDPDRICIRKGPYTPKLYAKVTSATPHKVPRYFQLFCATMNAELPERAGRSRFFFYEAYTCTLRGNMGTVYLHFFILFLFK